MTLKKTHATKNLLTVGLNLSPNSNVLLLIDLTETYCYKLKLYLEFSYVY